MSNQMWRLNDDSPLRNRTSLGSSHIKSTGIQGGLVASTSGGPAPTTWCAIRPPLDLAYTVSGALTGAVSRNPGEPSRAAPLPRTSSSTSTDLARYEASADAHNDTPIVELYRARTGVLCVEDRERICDAPLGVKRRSVRRL